MRADLVLRGGTVVDGSGSKPFVADVVVEGDRIERIGRYDGPADEVIDARGKMVTPGFVDIHTHLDAQITWDPLGSPSTQHGVTSAIVGNCGVGFAPCRPADRDYLMFLMEGVEDIPRAAMKAGMPWTWESFREYLEALESRPLGLNVGAHVSHAPIRVFAMGERGAKDEPATDADLASMRECVLDAMRAGALGLATGRTTLHRTPAGDPVPGTFADRRELDALSGALADYGTGVLELVALGIGGEDRTGFEKDFSWMLPVALATSRPISFGLLQATAYPDQWRDILKKVEEAWEQGARILPQVAARSVGLLMGFGISISPLLFFPAGAEIVGKPLAEQKAAVLDPAFREKLLASVRSSDGRFISGLATIDVLFPLDDRGVLSYETSPERSIRGMAERSGKHFGEVLLDYFVETDFKGFLIAPFLNPDLDAAAEMIDHPLTNIGLGDSGAHTSQTCDASYATFVLAYWVRERRRFTIEHAVRKLTWDPARVWGLHDRGLIRRGAAADLNVIDLDRLDVFAPEIRHEFPTGAPHLTQGARGYDATIVNGQVLMRDGAHTGALPGRVLRNELWAG